MICSQKLRDLAILALCSIALGFGQKAHPTSKAGSEFSLASPMRVVWQFKSDETINLTPSTDGKQLFVPMSAGGVVALNLMSGTLTWKENVGGEISADPVSDEFAVFIANEATSPKTGGPVQSSGAVRALSHESGVTLWMRTLPSPICGALALSDGILYGAAKNGDIYSFNEKSGETIWNIHLPVSFISHPVIAGGLLYLGAEDGTVFAIELKKGDVKWRYQTQGAVRGRLAVSENLVAVASTDGFVHGLELATGVLRWKVRTGAAVQSVAINKDLVIAASLDNFAYCIGEAKGTRIWKRQLDGRPLAEPLMDGDKIMFNPISGLGAVVLDTHDGKVLNTLPTGEDNNSGAAPVLAGGEVLLTTREGLIAFSPAK